MGLNRYKYLTNNDGSMQNFPRVTIKKRETDKYVLYNYSKTRLDRIAFQNYEDDTFWWIILLANPEYYLEFDIPNNTVLRVPYPILDVLGEVETKIINKKNKG